MSRALPGWARWLIAIGALLLGVTMLFASPTGESLQGQSSGDGWTCRHQTHLRFQPARTTDFDSVGTAEITFTEYTSGKGGRYEMGRIEVFDQRGRPHDMFRGPRPDARGMYEALDEFVEAAQSGARPDDLQLDEAPFLWGLGPSLLLVAAGLAVFFIGRRDDEVASPDPSPTATAGPDPQARLQRRVVIGVLGGVAVLVIVFTIVETLHQRGKGWVQVECVHRCKVEGMDCRPSGSVGSWQPPGTYTVEAYDPDAPTGWTPVSVEVEVGKRVRLECKPPASGEPSAP